MEFGWEWEKKKGDWVKFENEISNKLNDAVKNSEQNVQFSVESSNLAVDLNSMTQKNKTTSYQRSIRCTFKDADGVGHVWQWKDERGRWRSYSPQIVSQLENGRDTGTPLSFVVNEQSYTIDYDKMEQKNDVTGVTRTIVRESCSSAHSSTAVPAPPARMTRSQSSKKNKEEMNGTLPKEPEEEEEVKPPPSKRAKSSKPKSAAAASTSTATSSKKTVVLKGRAPIDSECTAKMGKAFVYYEGNDVYDGMLNQTNVQNNNNKYYILQLLQDDNSKIYSVWFRWGRVGFKGQNNLIPCGGDLEHAKQVFCGKFWDKTKNEWGQRKSFKKVPGKYDLLEMDYSVDKPEEKEPDAVSQPSVKEEEPIPDCKLDERIQALMKLICDIKAMEAAVVEMEYDAQKAPLGKLTTTQIKAGYTALQKIETCIEKNDIGRKLVDACNEYYTRIPHCFGMRTPPLIKDEKSLKKELDLLEALSEIEVAIRTLKKEGEGVRLNPIDRNYNSMECDLETLENESEQFKMVEQYLQNTHAPTHRTYKMTVRNIFAVQKHGEEFNDVGNRMLLWHGSRLTNWYGILSQGLRIAPPEAPVTGYMFGKGIYFADVSSKSANYCFATRQHNVGVVLLCEVALGKTNDLLAADYKADKLPTGCDSTKGLGSLEPDPKDTKTENGCAVPMGKIVSTGVTNPGGYTLNYNEFVVYDTRQIKLKYLVEVDFKF